MNENQRKVVRKFFSANANHERLEEFIKNNELQDEGKTASETASDILRALHG